MSLEVDKVGRWGKKDGSKGVFGSSRRFFDDDRGPRNRYG